MAVSAGFTANVYGIVQGSPPFTDASGATAFSLVIPFNSPQAWSLPSGPVNIIPLANGFQMPSGMYVYSVIQAPPSGLNVHGVNYVSNQSAASLATLRG